MLTDREAASRRAGMASSEIGVKVHRLIRAGSTAGTVSQGLVLGNSIRPAVAELRKQLVAIYSPIDGSSEPPLCDELIEDIKTRLIALIRSSLAGARNTNGTVARLAAELEANVQISVQPEFELAAYEAHRGRGSPVPVRRKQDKFQLLDVEREHYEEDFKNGIGLLGAAVIFFDIDHFKAINTQFTEPVVDDAILIHLHKLVAALTERRGFSYAQGGDEFLILLPNTSVEIAEAFVQELLSRLRSMNFNVNNEEVKVTASAGVCWSLEPTQAKACLKAAAEAKGDAKKQGRNCYRVKALIEDKSA